MKRLDPGPFVLPMPTVLVGADIAGKPLLFTFSDLSYWKLGSYVGKPWQIGRAYRDKK